MKTKYGSIENNRTNNTNINNKENNIQNNIYSQENEIIKEELKPKKSKEQILKESIIYIIDYLNDTASTKYRYNTKGTVNLIKARFKEGFTIDDFYDVIDKKWKDWKNTEWQKYIRPETLFGNKFEAYLNEKNTFKGNPKINYDVRPNFDNTANHNIPKAISSMTKEEKEKFMEEELAKDENGNLIKF